jgi:RNA polymerase sigma-70 factor (ECF subfamily)
MEVTTMSADLLRRAQSGDREAFAELVAPLRGDVQLLCYRMLGSLQDAEDTLQEVLLAAWIGLPGFEGRSSFRTWLHRIATHRCLNVLRAGSRRPVESVQHAFPTPEWTRLGDLPWLQPYPDLMLEGLPDRDPGPEVCYELREAVSLAFITAVQLLPPNQRAVLLLRDVFGYRAAEAADLLGLTESAVNSALKRARATLQETYTHEASTRVPNGLEERDLIERWMKAFTALDVDGMIALMTDDVWVRMPPMPFEYHGREAVHRFFHAMDVVRRRTKRLVPIRANGQPAFGEYVMDRTTGIFHCVGVVVVDCGCGLISELVHFESGIAQYFGLPRTLVD